MTDSVVRVRWGVGSGPDLGMRDDKDSDVDQVQMLQRMSLSEGRG